MRASREGIPGMGFPVRGGDRHDRQGALRQAEEDPERTRRQARCGPASGRMHLRGRVPRDMPEMQAGGGDSEQGSLPEGHGGCGSHDARDLARRMHPAGAADIVRRGSVRGHRVHRRAGAELGHEGQGLRQGRRRQGRTQQIIEANRKASPRRPRLPTCPTT